MFGLGMNLVLVGLFWSFWFFCLIWFFFREINEEFMGKRGIGFEFVICIVFYWGDEVKDVDIGKKKGEW